MFLLSTLFCALYATAPVYSATFLTLSPIEDALRSLELWNSSNASFFHDTSSGHKFGCGEATCSNNTLWSYARNLTANFANSLKNTGNDLSGSNAYPWAESAKLTIRRLLSTIRSLLQSFVLPMLETVKRTVFDQVNDLPVRVQKSINALGLLTSFAKAAMHPIKYAKSWLNALQLSARECIVQIATRLLRLFSNFLSTTGLPWLHRILDSAASSTNLPTSLRSFIKIFDSVYSILTLLGYVSN